MMLGWYMLALSCQLLLLVSGSTVYKEDYRDDEILDLPGLHPKPTFRQYSGYVLAGSTKLLHYWLVESSRDAASDPLVVWFNGGPGCSSLDGLLTENGPFRVREGGQELYYNKYSWNRIANVLYLETPAGVGFSFSRNKNYTTNDDETAADNHAALADFLRKFPHYRQRPLYITGESYAGIYIPTLLQLLLPDKSFNLKGAAIGNGYLRPALLEATKFPYWYYHGIIDTQMWEELKTACCAPGVGDGCQYLPFRHQQCQYMVGKVQLKVLSYAVDPYNIYGSCDGSTPKRIQHAKTVLSIGHILRDMQKTFDDKKLLKEIIDFNMEMTRGIPCADNSGMETYLRRRDVQDALHVATDLPPYKVCSDLVVSEMGSRGSYLMLYDDMAPQIKEIQADGRIRMLIYNGDMDTVCNFLGDELFVESLGLKVRSAWKAWHYLAENGSKQVGGFHKSFERLTYLTVKGAGHMVPTDQPVSSFQMFAAFLHNDNFQEPRYHVAGVKETD